ncbi:MAG: exo-alpha-sialidase [Verrucomicrobia bacterium]|nr:exo-alpha-sialidase [Verrucomicrobiota bacterium]
MIAGEEMVLSKSLDSGATFGPPSVVFRAEGLFDGPDKSWLAINTFPRSPTANRMAAVAWMGRANQTSLTYSDDGGATWSSPKPVGSPNATGAQPFFLPDGSLAILYWHLLGSYYDNNSSRIELIVSPDGGETFGPTNVVQVMSGFWFDDPIAETGPQFPSACADRQAGLIYLTYQAWNGAAPNRVRRILFTKSIDRGQTWSAPVPVSDTPAGKSVFNLVIAASPDGQHVTIAFADKRHQTTNSFDNFVDYYLAESFDGGDTWQPNVRLSEFSSDLRKAANTGKPSFGEYQGIVPALNFDWPGVAVWIDTRSGNADPYVVRVNRTKGTTFDAWRRLRFSTNHLANLAVSGENADPDGDGIPNLAEYAFDLEPNHPDAGRLKLTQGAPGPSAAVTVAYERWAMLSDIAFSWESSADLAS